WGTMSPWRRDALAFALGTLAPAFLEPVDDGSLAATATSAAGGRAASDTKLRMASPPQGLQPERNGDQHEHETAHAQRNVLGGDTVNQYGEPQDHGDGRKNDPPTRVEPRVGGTNRRGEFRVLGQRPLDLIEQPLLVFGQRHCPSPAITADPVGPTDRTQPDGCMVQVYEGHSGSESGSKSRSAQLRSGGTANGVVAGRI